MRRWPCGAGDACFFAVAVCAGAGARVEIARRETAGDVRGKGAMCDRLEERRFEEADGEQSAKERQEGTRFTAQTVRQCGFSAWGVCARFIFDVRKSRNAGVMRAVWNGVQIWARVAIERSKHDGSLSHQVWRQDADRPTCAVQERCERRLKPLFVGLAGKPAGDTLSPWRCAPGAGRALRLRGERTTRGG